MKTEQTPLWRWAFVAVLVALTGQHAPGQQAKPWATLQGHPSWVTSLVFSPDGKPLALN